MSLEILSMYDWHVSVSNANSGMCPHVHTILYSGMLMNGIICLLAMGLIVKLLRFPYLKTHRGLMFKASF